MSEGAANLLDHVLPDVPVRQFALTMPFPLRFPLAFDGKLLGQVVRLFTDTVSRWYRNRHQARGLPDGEYIRWSELLRRVFAIETICQTCRAPLRLLSLVKSEAVAKKILTAMHLSADVPELRPARAPPGRDPDARGAEDYIN